MRRCNQCRNQPIIGGVPAIFRRDHFPESSAASSFLVIIEQASQTGCDRFFVERVEVPASLAADLGQGGRIGQGHWQPLGHGLDGRDAEAFAERWKHERGRLGIDGTQVVSLTISRHADQNAWAGRRGRLVQNSGFLVGSGADQHNGQIAGRHLREPQCCAEEPDEILARLEVRHRE